MKNNRKQRIESVLDSLSQKEIDEYISNRNLLNTKTKELLDKLKVNRQYNHSNIIFEKLNKDFGEFLNSYYKMGEAYIIAFVLECFYDEKYKIKDLKQYLKAIIESDKQLKEYVYDMMKDF